MGVGLSLYVTVGVQGYYVHAVVQYCLKSQNKPASLKGEKQMRMKVPSLLFFFLGAYMVTVYLV